MANDLLSDGFVNLCVNTDSNILGKGCKILVEGAMITKAATTPTDPGDGSGGTDPTDPGTGDGGTDPTNPGDGSGGDTGGGDGGTTPTDPGTGDGGTTPTDPGTGDGGTTPTDPGTGTGGGDTGTTPTDPGTGDGTGTVAAKYVRPKAKYHLVGGRMVPLADNDDTNAVGNAVPNQILEITNERQIETAFGRGSILATTLKTVLCMCPTAQIFALPRADEEGATKAEFTYSINAENGAATSNGRVMLYFGDQKYMVDFPVKTGDDAKTIAQKIKDQLPNDFPYDVEVVDSGTAEKTQLKFTAKNAGSIGNSLMPVYNWPGRADTAPGGISLETDSTTAGTDGTFAGDYEDELGECCYDCYILSSLSQQNQDALRDHIRKSWDCNEGQCFGHGYTISAGTPDEIMATFDNSPELSRLAWPDDYSPELPYLVNAAYGALSCCTACEHPEISIQGRQNGLLSCLKMPQSCSAALSRNDKELLKENGFVIASPAETGLGGLTSPYIENDITNYLYDNNGRDNATYRSTSSRRLAKATALALAAELQDLNGLSLFTRNTMIGVGVKGITVPMIEGRIRTFAKENVGVLFSEFDDVSDQIQLLTDFETQPKCQGRPGILHLNFAYRAPERLEGITATVTPRLIDNCN